MLPSAPFQVEANNKQMATSTSSMLVKKTTFVRREQTRNMKVKIPMKRKKKPDIVRTKSSRDQQQEVNLPILASYDSRALTFSSGVVAVRRN